MRPPAPSAVLVTGATGFIGRQVVRRLLDTARPVVALARGRGRDAARDRVARAVAHRPGDPAFDVVEGDLTHPRCALPPGELERLRASAETLIHCAGDTTFFPDAPAAFRAGHVDGPVALLRALAGGGLQRWVQVSTAFVCGRRSGRILEREGDVGQAFHNPYERAKLDAETALRAEGARHGVDVRVLRPSIVVGPAPETAGGTPANLFFAFVRLVAMLGQLAARRELPLRIQARPGARFNIVPVDHVARAVVALAEHPEGTPGTVHLVADAPSQQDVLAHICRRLDVRGLRLVDERPRDPSPLERRIARMLAPYQEYLDQDVIFDATAARALLAPPPRLGADAIDDLIDLALVTASHERRIGTPRAPAPAGDRR